MLHSAVRRPLLFSFIVVVTFVVTFVVTLGSAAMHIEKVNRTSSLEGLGARRLPGGRNITSLNSVLQVVLAPCRTNEPVFILLKGGARLDARPT